MECAGGIEGRLAIALGGEGGRKARDEVERTLTLR
jgi:hypothetical protein